MKKILLILGILVFINILVITVSKVFAQEASIDLQHITLSVQVVK